MVGLDIDSKAVSAGGNVIIKGVIVVAAIGGTVAAVYFTAKWIRKMQDEKYSKGEAKDISSDLKQILKTQNPTLSDSQISGIANNLFQAMDGYGVDEDSVLHELAKINNEADWLSVKDKFGVRTISSGFGNPTANPTGSLMELLSIKLDPEYKTASNNMLARKGIKNRI